MHELDCCLGEISYFCNIMSLQHVWWWTGNCPHASSIWAHAAIIMGVYCIEVSWVLNWFCSCNIVGGRSLTVIQLCMQIAVNLLLGALHETLRALKGDHFIWVLSTMKSEAFNGTVPIWYHKGRIFRLFHVSFCRQWIKSRACNGAVPILYHKGLNFKPVDEYVEALFSTTELLFRFHKSLNV